MLDRISKAAEDVVCGLSRRRFLSAVGKAALPVAAVVSGVLATVRPVKADGSYYYCCYWICNGQQKIKCAVNQSCRDAGPPQQGCDLSGGDQFQGDDCAECGTPPQYNCCHYNCPGLTLPARGVVLPPDTHQLCAGEGECVKVINDPRAPNGWPLPGHPNVRIPVKCFLKNGTQVESCDDCPEG